MNASRTSDFVQSPEMFPGHNHEKEVPYVQISNPGLDPDVLRALSDQAAQMQVSREQLAGFVDRHLSHVLPHHQEIITVALENEVSLFCGPPPFADDIPLWMQLVHRERGGLRQVSPDWLISSDNFLARLGISSSAGRLVEAGTQDPFLAYRLGQHGFAEKLAAALPDHKRRALLQRIAIACDKLGDTTLLKLWKQPSADGESESLLASYFVHQTKRGRTVDERNIDRLEGWAHALLKSSCDDDMLARGCHVLNSLNYVWLKGNRIDRLESVIQQAEGIGAKISETKLRAHILGNAFFHRSILAKLCGDREREKSYLAEAARLDHGFTDYNYRIAMILHERGDQSAREQYEAAIRTSPFNFSVVNDYGVFLSEYGTPDEIRSWEAVATFFFQAETGEGTE